MIRPANCYSLRLRRKQSPPSRIKLQSEENWENFPEFYQLYTLLLNIVFHCRLNHSSQTRLKHLWITALPMFNQKGLISFHILECFWLFFILTSTKGNVYTCHYSIYWLHSQSKWHWPPPMDSMLFTSALIIWKINRCLLNLIREDNYPT